ncbi:PREDICTED: LOW QUALITY PROTEIN: filamin-binding LIM protein 1 [Pygoscelis adeliae]|uniref:LOW QUALITY PROTEIN: filamin-binding LIM protein 1 n=1 Tax=Pygoscelis adeliae TaxID=9238 RepID=UPI0004F4E9BE|nr:PREDICTED: LOW QUALITY PROTEIN: filamin-binding LIM protein 1 [Pygoscelis adeliae]
MRPGSSSHRSGPSAAFAMLPGKAEKRIASSIFITLVPPQREAATKEKTQRETRPDSAEVPGTRHPQTRPLQPPALLNGGTYRHCLSPPAGMAFAFGAETRPAAPVPSSPTVLVLSEAPQPLSAEALGPALQQRHLAAPATLQAPSAFPAELRPPKFCQEQAGKPQWQDANGYPERDGSRGKGRTQLCSVGSPPAGKTEARGTEPRSPPPPASSPCRTCHRGSWGQRYYQKDGRPMCDACYQATLEKCAKCQGLIVERIVRALGKGYHPGCFSCAACGRAIGAESFAVDEQNEVYCVADFYRKYAVVCSACKHPIVPREDKDTYKIECLGRSFHESCYCCESCGTPLSPEPTENGCYPLNHAHPRRKSCHVRRRNESSC